MRVPKKMVEDMASQIVQELKTRDFVAHPDQERLYQMIYQVILEELMVEDKIDDEVRQILNEHTDEIQRANVQYHEMFRKVKAKLQKERNLIF